MNFITLTGMVISDVKIINLTSGVPLCRFTLEADGRKFYCLVSGMMAYDFVYKVQLGAMLTFEARINDRMQLVLLNYHVMTPSVSSLMNDRLQTSGYPHKKIS
ncbi:ssDNA-binding protein [Carnobacterium gallinarum]|uniref:ssDNA-binding protein n=1 Tax=Carnobacterium gallinarum TaxID=2749 RepID=UPI000558E0D8|nr:ssDNA-binding protein [Carnobacterium gallinarum]